METGRNEAEKKDVLFISTKYPHDLLFRIKRLLKSEQKDRTWLLKEEFLTVFSSCYPEYRAEAERLKSAMNLEVIKGFYEQMGAAAWKQRVHVQKSLFSLIKIMKEYEAVEIIESLMWLFDWDLEMKIERKWSIEEDEKTEIHDLLMTERKNASGVLEIQKSKEENIVRKRESIQGKRYASSDNQHDSERKKDFDKSKMKQERIDLASKRQQIMNGSKKNGLRVKGAMGGSIGSSAHLETKSFFGQDITEGIRDKSRDDILEILKYVLSMLLMEDKVSDVEYERQLRDMTFKHERLMSLSVRKEANRAKRGDSRAQCAMGEFYAQENTGHTDYFEAAKWYSLAARQGSDKAKLELGKIFDSEKLLEDPVEGKRLLERVDAISTKQYGIMYFKELAEKGYPTAQSILGMKYYFGDGVEKDTAKGIRWLKRAAEQGHTEAQRKLGELYANIDEKESKKWFSKAGL